MGHMRAEESGWARTDFWRLSEEPSVYARDPLPAEALPGDEAVLQRIWEGGDFQPLTETDQGERLRILDPGRRNPHAGPDFADALIEISGKRLCGAIELHLTADGWYAHRHERDPAYRGVVLHVLLHPAPRGMPPAWTDTGRAVASVALLPRLKRPWAEEVALESILRRAREEPLADLVQSWAVLPIAARREELLRCAHQRWEEKLAYAQQRVSLLGWEAACHQTALEVLGYRRNRAAMLAVATRFPLARWRAGRLSVPSLLAAGGGRWNRQRTRPANQPRRRLAQYAEWVQRVPAWPQALAEMPLPDHFDATDPFDAVTPTHWREELFGGLSLGLRERTLVVDGFLPLRAAHSPQAASVCERLWLDWPAGDLPEALPQVAKKLGVVSTRGAPSYPLGTVSEPHPPMRWCNGLAQGLLTYWFRENR